MLTTRDRTLPWRVAGWIAGFIALSLGVICCPHLWDDLLRKRWREVSLGKLYRSGQLSAALVENMLRRHRIAVVVDLANLDRSDPAERAEELACERLGIKQVRLALAGDGTGRVEHYAQAIAEISHGVERGKPVLVHCRAGVQRTGGVVAAYRLLVDEAPPAVVYQELLEAGWDPARDQRVLLFVNEHLPAMASQLVEQRVLREAPSPLPILAP